MTKVDYSVLKADYDLAQDTEKIMNNFTLCKSSVGDKECCRCLKSKPKWNNLVKTLNSFGTDFAIMFDMKITKIPVGWYNIFNLRYVLAAHLNSENGKPYLQVQERVDSKKNIPLEMNKQYSVEMVHAAEIFSVKVNGQQVWQKNSDSATYQNVKFYWSDPFKSSAGEVAILSMPNIRQVYQPIGPQKSVPETRVVNGGWALCHKEYYNVEMTDSSIETIQGKCTRDKIMLACRPVGASKLTALAWADRATVFGVTDSPRCRYSCSGRVVQGTRWYRTTKGKKNGAWGFADGASSIYLGYPDTLNSDGDKRLSWYLDSSNGSDWGGYRCGTSKPLYFSQDWERVIYHAD